jgi:hypothetical protein
MKTRIIFKRPVQLNPDSEYRLLAYATAAGVGAFFTPHRVEAQVVESQALGPYPHILSKGTGAGYYKTYNYMDVDGDGISDFNLNVDSFRVNMDKASNSQTNLLLNPSSNGYIIPWTNGAVLDSGTGLAPTYKKWLASSIYYNAGWYYLFNDFPTSEALGFSFTAGDGQTHFGYMDIAVNHTQGANNDFTATVYGVYYNKTPNAAITIGAVPVEVTITNITTGPGNTVTMDFTSTDNAPASTFKLETSANLGSAASWVLDTGAVISSNSAGKYQAVTTATGGPAQFYRISH